MGVGRVATVGKESLENQSEKKRPKKALLEKIGPNEGL